jgi:UrcA family protein
MNRSYNTADPFLLQLDQLDWVEETPIRGIGAFFVRQIASIRARPGLFLGLTIAAFTIAFGVVGVAKPHDPVPPPSLSVRYDDLDFSHAPDAQVMLDRIEAAAEKACGGTPDFREYRQLAVFDHCRRGAIKQTVDQLDKPMLTKVAEAQPMPMHLVIR